MQHRPTDPTTICSVQEITELLRRMSRGETGAAERVRELLRDQMRTYARHFRSEEGLQTTALVNEVYLRIRGRQPDEWLDRRQFLDAAAGAMLDVLAEQGDDEARRLETALGTLRELDGEAARVVEYRYLFGFDSADVAATLDIGPEAAERKWRLARAFLYREMQ